MQNLGWELALNHQVTRGELYLTRPQYYYCIVLGSIRIPRKPFQVSTGRTALH